MMKTIERFETLTGIGEVFDGDKRIAKVRYVISIAQDVFDGGARGLKNISGIIEPAPGEAQHVVMFNVFNCEAPRLRLEDGRWWHFFLTNSNGTAVNRQGGLTED